MDLTWGPGSSQWGSKLVISLPPPRGSHPVVFFLGRLQGLFQRVYL